MPTKPKTFSMHWGSGVIAEEARFESEYHVPCIQLMEYTEGEAAGSVSVRFCTYSHRGSFQRSPLIVNEEDIAGLRAALEKTPRLQALLRRLVE
ncbi:hypothetical protein J0H33_04935 [bacterium]|nr:hypothetical protein [bacterium]